MPETIGHGLTLAVDASGHVFDGDDEADNPALLAERPDGDVLLHPVEAGRRFRGRAGEEVVVQRRSQHFNGSLRQDVVQHSKEAAGLDVRNHLDERPAQGPRRSIPVASAIQPSHVRTTRRSSVVKIPRGRRSGDMKRSHQANRTGAPCGRH